MPSSSASPAAQHPLLLPTIIGSQFIQPFMASGIAVALPAIGTDTGAGSTSLGLVATLFLAGSVSALLPAGRLADASDRATLYKFGLLACGLSSLLLALLSSVPLILLVRFLQGTLAALITVTGPALLTDIVAPERRGRAYGAMLASVYCGLTLGPAVAGLLVDALGWRSVFFAGGGALLVFAILAHQVLPSRWRSAAPGAVHLPSALLLAAVMLLLVLGSGNLRAGPASYAMLGAGAVLGVTFLQLQRHLAQPLLDVELLLRNRVLRSALVMQALLYTSAISVAFLLGIYMQVTLGKSALLSGQVLALGSLLMAVVAPLAGALSDRYRPAPIALGGMALVGVTALASTSFDAASSLAVVSAVLALQGIGFALFSSPNMAIIMNSVPRAQASTASALAAKSRSFGMLAGMAIAAAMISLHLGNEPVEREPLRFIAPMQAAFWVLTCLAAIALALGLATGRRPAKASDGGGPR